MARINGKRVRELALHTAIAINCPQISRSSEDSWVGLLLEQIGKTEDDESKRAQIMNARHDIWSRKYEEKK